MKCCAGIAMFFLAQYQKIYRVNMIKNYKSFALFRQTDDEDNFTVYHSTM
jgi:hypothetical protein